MKIVPARPEDAGALTTIALAAKRHWGYPEEWIVRWQEALTITPDYIRVHPTFAAEVDDRIVGFGAVQLRPDGAWLDHLWVMPPTMGQGIGRALFSRAETIARESGATWLRF